MEGRLGQLIANFREGNTLLHFHVANESTRMRLRFDNAWFRALEKPPKLHIYLKTPSSTSSLMLQNVVSLLVSLMHVRLSCNWHCISDELYLMRVSYFEINELLYQANSGTELVNFWTVTFPRPLSSTNGYCTSLTISISIKLVVLYRCCWERRASQNPPRLQ